jgi:DNA repair protein RadC
VHPREVFQPAISCFACSVILAHNHPDNNIEISDADRKMTEKLIQSGAILDIEVIDHIIVTNNNYVSFKEKGILF